DLIDIVEDQTNYIIECPVPGETMFLMVKPVELTETASGSYFNGGTGVMVEVIVDPAAFPGADFEFMTEFEQVEFQNLSVNAQFYEWSFGDGAFSSETSPVHTYKMAGTYQVCVYAHNDDDCQGVELCKEITIVSSLPDFVTGDVKSVS